MTNVRDVRWFCHNDEECKAFFERLKLTPCPHCHVVGALIRHGSLFAFDDSSPQRKTLRARRVFCSNRNRRPGCGRTTSVWLADKIRRISVTTHSLWRFLQRAAAGSIAAAIRATNSQRSERAWQRLWRRVYLGQSKIRTALFSRCPAPQPPNHPTYAATHTAHVLAHLRAAFPTADCPIAAFQQAMRTFFV